MARNKKVEILSNDKEVLHPMTDGDCVIFEDGQTLAQKLSEDDSVKYTPEIVNSSPMFKVGEGNTVDYSDNVLDGAYERATLQGQTYVNYIQESSADEVTLPTPFTEYERTQHNTLTSDEEGTLGINLVGQSYVNALQHDSEEEFVVLGESLEFQNKKVEYTNEGQIKSAMLKGQTLVNLVKQSDSTPMYTTRTPITNGYQYTQQYNEASMTATRIQWTSEKGSKLFKPSTKYYVQCEIKVNKYRGLRVQSNGTGGVGYVVSLQENSTTSIKGVFTTSTDFTLIYFYVYPPQSQDLASYIDDVFEIKNLMIIEYQDGMENWDIPYFEGMQSVTMTTELENVCSRYNSSSAKNGKTFTVGTWENRGLTLSTTDNIAKYNFKPNTKYLVQFKATNLNLDGLSSMKIAFSDSEISTGNSLFGNDAVVEIKSNGIYRIVLTTSNVISTSNFVVKGLGIQWEDTTSTLRKLTISNIMCIEYQNGMENWDLPYFETTQLMKPIKTYSTNKNTFNKNMFSVAKGSLYGYWKFKNDETKSYTLSITDKDTSVDIAGVYFGVSARGFDSKNNNGASDFQWLVEPRPENKFTNLTTTKNFISFFPNNQATLDKICSRYNIQLEEASSITPYTPHQSKTTSALEPITLRAIGDVKDTLDLSTGEYVQRIGEITVDGVNAKAKESITNNEWGETSRRFDLDITGVKRVAGWNDATTIIKSDKINVFDDIGVANPQCNSLYKWDDVIVLYINDSTITTIDQANNWLEQNPIKVQYQLANPITRKISLEHPNLQTYQDITHIQSIAMDGTLIPNIFLPSDISYKAMLKPNTSYNVIVDREVIDSTNQLTVNLGGTTANITANRTVVTTPSTLSSETLTFSGKDNRLAKAMLIEGSTLINGDLPHFDGIGDVKLGRVVENLCMANHTTVGGATSTGTLYSDKITSKITKTGSHVHIFQLTKNLENSKRYFIYCPYDYQYIIYGFRHEYNNSLSYTHQSCEGVNKKYAIIKIDGNQQKNPYTHLAVGCHDNIPVDTTMTIRRPILCEYIDGMENWDWESIGYFTGTRNIGNEFMRIGNKNLFDGINRKYFINFETYLMGLTNGDSGGVVDVSNINNVVVSTTSTQTRFRVGCTNKLPSQINETSIIYNGINLDGNSSNKVSIDCSNYKYLIINAVDLSIVQIEEASSATSYVAHKHNSLHISPNEQIPLTFVQGRIDYANGDSWTNATNNIATQVIRTDLLDLEPNETYRVSCGHSDFMFAVGLYNNSLLGSSVISYTSDRERYITTTKDVHKIGIATMRKNSTNITPSVLHQVRLEKVTDVHLRSVSGVKDELDLTRGVYIQRINEVVLNGSGSISLNTHYSKDNVLCFDIYDNKKGKIYEQSYAGGLICDKLIPRNWLSFYGSKIDEEGIVLNRDNGTTILIKIAKTKLATQDVSGVKAYLKDNPITVQYELETPIEHKINIQKKNELNQTIAKRNGVFTLPLMYSETNHIDINSQIYPKVQSRDYIAYPVLPMIGRTYTLQHNLTGGVSNLTVDLLGRTQQITYQEPKALIYSPETMDAILHNELRISGKGKISKVMYIDGGYMDRDIPYIEGMKNAVNPIVKNIGKNLFDGMVKNGESWWDGKTGIIARCRRSVNLTPVKPNTEYVFKLTNRYGIGCGANFMAHGKDGKFLKYIGWVLSDTSKFTTPSDCYYIHWYNDIDDFTDFYIEESSTPSQYEPYKENICEPECGEIKLTENIMTLGTINDSSVGTHYESTLTNSNLRIRTKAPIKVKPNTTYARKLPSDYIGWVVTYDSEMRYTGETFWDETFTTPINVHYIIPVFRKVSNVNMSLSEWDKLHIFELSDVIHLRSLPNGVRDELNLQTGEYIQRIGEVVLDGSDDEEWWMGGCLDDTEKRFGITKTDMKIETNYNNSNHLLCDKYNTVSFNELFGQNKNGIASWNIGTSISIKNGMTDLAIFKQHLQTNPITIQYELSTPIVKQIDISNFPHSYEGGHVIIESGDPNTPIPAQLTYRVVTNRSGQIQQHTEQVEKQEREINELETLILANIHLSQTR